MKQGSSKRLNGWRAILVANLVPLMVPLITTSPPYRRIPILVTLMLPWSPARLRSGIIRMLARIVSNDRALGETLRRLRDIFMELASGLRDTKEEVLRCSYYILLKKSLRSNSSRINCLERPSQGRTSSPSQHVETAHTNGHAHDHSRNQVESTYSKTYESVLRREHQESFDRQRTPSPPVRRRSKEQVFEISIHPVL